jgi:hypothetical protein
LSDGQGGMGVGVSVRCGAEVPALINSLQPASAP